MALFSEIGDYGMAPPSILIGIVPILSPPELALTDVQSPARILVVFQRDSWDWNQWVCFPFRPKFLQADRSLSETVVFRNMCGHSGPEMNAILALDYFVNFSEVMIIHHTGKLSVTLLKSFR